MISIAAVAWLVLAAADPVRDAERALENLEYARAAELSLAALKQGQAAPAQVQRLWAARAQALAAQGFADDARVAFERTLSLLPTFEISPDASPKLSEPFRAARERLQGQRLGATSRAQVQDARVSLTVTVLADVAGLVAAGEVEVEGAPAQALARQGAQLSGLLRCQAPCPHRVVLRDDFGNRLLEIGTAAAPLLVDGVAPAPVVSAPPAAVDERALEPAGPSFFARPLPWAVAAGAFAAVATVFAVRTAQDAQGL
ncbi:MAG: hypothetical protein K1X89_32180, partial [Myxococcaceae bacterium]|nr:hypothetical protein [Myxococcaceae bacterium]